MKLKYVTAVLAALPMMALSTPATEYQQDLISFSSSVEKEVARDLMRVSLYMRDEGTDFKQLSKAATERLNEAVSVAKKQSAVEIIHNNQSTQVRYDNKGKKNGWISRVDLQLQSKNFDQISQIIAELNAQFVIDSVNFDLSSELRKSLEDEMLESALAKFNHQALLIQKGLNASGYKIDRLSVNNHNGNYYRSYDREFLAAPAAPMKLSSSLAEEPALNLDNGKAKVHASVEATIQLTRE